MVHKWFNVADSPYCLRYDSEDSDDYCDTEVGEPIHKMKKQARNFQAHWKCNLP